MWWCEQPISRRSLGRFAFAAAVAGLTAGCFEPLYGTRPDAGSEGVGAKFAAVDIPPISAPKGQPAGRLAVALRNALQYEFNGGAGAHAPTHRLEVSVGTGTMTVIVDVTSGRPDAQVDSVSARYSLIEIASGKTVVSGSTTARVDFDIPGSAQRFAALRAQRDAEDRATQVVADAIRNRLASYFVAGT